MPRPLLATVPDQRAARRPGPIPATTRALPLASIAAVLLFGTPGSILWGAELPRGLREVERPAACDGIVGRVLPDQPSVYITFEGRGAMLDSLHSHFAEPTPSEPPLKPGDDYLLRLHNNSCWPISFETYSMYLAQPRELVRLDSERRSFAVADGAEIGVYYRVRKENGNTVEIPLPDMRFQTWLPAGRSVVFAVARQHLKRHRIVSIDFLFGWEAAQSFGGPLHRVEFRGEPSGR